MQLVEVQPLWTTVSLLPVRECPARTGEEAGQEGGREWKLLLVVIHEGRGRVGRAGMPFLAEVPSTRGREWPLLQSILHLWCPCQGCRSSSITDFLLPSPCTLQGRTRDGQDVQSFCSAEETRAPHLRGSHRALLPQQLPGPVAGLMD